MRSGWCRDTLFFPPHLEGVPQRCCIPDVTWCGTGRLWVTSSRFCRARTVHVNTRRCATTSSTPGSQAQASSHRPRNPVSFVGQRAPLPARASNSVRQPNERTLKARCWVLGAGCPTPGYSLASSKTCPSDGTCCASPVPLPRLVDGHSGEDNCAIFAKVAASTLGTEGGDVFPAAEEAVGRRMCCNRSVSQERGWILADVPGFPSSLSVSERKQSTSVPSSFWSN